jgi:hypothetical protein
VLNREVDEISIDKDMVGRSKLQVVLKEETDSAFLDVLDLKLVELSLLHFFLFAFFLLRRVLLDYL